MCSAKQILETLKWFGKIPLGISRVKTFVNSFDLPHAEIFSAFGFRFLVFDFNIKSELNKHDALSSCLSSP